MMRAIDAPDQDPCWVYITCVNSIASYNLRDRLAALTNSICISAVDYQTKASTNQLFTLLPCLCGNSDIVMGEVTKKELKDLYSSHMVAPRKPGRKVYDYLLSRAPLGRCPFCGIGQVSTLDHYLPKARYPQFSVVPLNLVPSCKDCNTGKSNAIAVTAGSQCLHPYFDQQNFINDQWLFAEVAHTAPTTIKFYVKEPVYWDDVSKERVRAHFEGFKLRSRYSIEAGDQIACLRDTLCQYREILGLDGVKQHLELEARAQFRQHRNSWQTAMFQALACSDWYCNGGYM